MVKCGRRCQDQWQVQLDLRGIDVLLTSDQLACETDADGARGTEGANAAEEAVDIGGGTVVDEATAAMPEGGGTVGGDEVAAGGATI